MRGSTESDAGPAATEAAREREAAGNADEPTEGADEPTGDSEEHAGGVAQYAEDARRARWAAVGTGALLTCAGLGAALLRSAGAAPALVPTAYALGAAVCALAAVLGARGRTRRALWLLIAGVMIMAVGDQFD
ncbi:hypothetical protein OG350_26330 [Streptomyces achromogenes]|uniref:Uncharacterized protein n=1 Tax=Streptomyces achromogenes TaxID=67255 RepID=A0ABZ1KYQ4_STRAH